MFLFSNEGSHRYSLAEDKFEKLPRITTCDYPSACSLGYKVYVLDPESRAIKVLHNPDAPVSSQEMHWQEIEVPGNIPIAVNTPAFAPFNSTEIVIVGAYSSKGKMAGDMVTFNTSTCKFKKEVDGTVPFTSDDNMSTKVCVNSIVFLVE